MKLSFDREKQSERNRGDRAAKVWRGQHKSAFPIRPLPKDTGFVGPGATREAKRFGALLAMNTVANHAAGPQPMSRQVRRRHERRVAAGYRA